MKEEGAEGKREAAEIIQIHTTFRTPAKEGKELRITVLIKKEFKEVVSPVWMGFPFFNHSHVLQLRASFHTCPERG